jgi:hypothetical protein
LKPYRPFLGIFDGSALTLANVVLAMPCGTGAEPGRAWLWTPIAASTPRAAQVFLPFAEGRLHRLSDFGLTLDFDRYNPDFCGAILDARRRGPSRARAASGAPLMWASAAESVFVRADLADVVAKLFPAPVLA